MIRGWELNFGGDTSMTDIDFLKIRTLNGSQSEAFEELCAQLARSEIPKHARFVRNAPPDAGVEWIKSLFVCKIAPS